MPVSLRKPRPLRIAQLRGTIIARSIAASATFNYADPNVRAHNAINLRDVCNRYPDIAAYHARLRLAR